MSKLFLEGRRVLYRNDEDNEYIAIITRVWTQEIVNLCVFDDGGDPAKRPAKTATSIKASAFGETNSWYPLPGADWPEGDMQALRDFLTTERAEPDGDPNAEPAKEYTSPTGQDGDQDNNPGPDDAEEAVPA